MSFLQHDMTPLDPLVLKQLEKQECQVKFERPRQTKTRMESITMENAPRQISVVVTSTKRMEPVDHFAPGGHHLDGSENRAGSNNSSSSSFNNNRSSQRQTPENPLFGYSTHRRLQASLTAPPSFSYGLKRQPPSDTSPVRLSEMHHKAEEMRLAEERQREEAQMRRAQASADRQRPDGWILETAMQKPRHGYLHGARIQRQISLQDQYQDRSMDTRSPTTRHKHQLEEHHLVTEKDREYLAFIEKQRQEVQQHREAEDQEFRQLPEKTISDVIKDHSAEPRPRIPRVPGNDVQDHLQLNKELRQQHSPQMQEYRTILEHQMEEAAHNRIDQLESDSLFKPYNLASHRRRSEHTAPVGTTDRIIDGGRVQEHYEQLTAVQSTLADRMPYGRIIRNQPKAPTAEEQDRRLQKQRERQQILDQLRRDRETLQQRLNEEEQTITAQGPPKILPNGQYTRKPFYGLKTGEIVDVDDNVRSLRRQQLEEYARELRQAHQNQLCREQEQRESEHRVDTETAHADHWKWNKDRLDRTQPRAPLDKELFIGLTPVKTLDSKEAQALADTLKRQDAEIKGRRQTVVEQEIQEELKHLDNHLDLRMKQRDQEDKKRSKALRTMENDRWTVDNSPHRSKTDHVASLLPRND